MRKMIWPRLALDFTALFRQGNRSSAVSIAPQGTQGACFWICERDSGNSVTFNLQPEPIAAPRSESITTQLRAFWWSSRRLPRQNNGCPPPYSIRDHP